MICAVNNRMAKIVASNGLHNRHSRETRNYTWYLPGVVSANAPWLQASTEGDPAIRQCPAGLLHAVAITTCMSAVSCHGAPAAIALRRSSALMPRRNPLLRGSGHRGRQALPKDSRRRRGSSSSSLEAGPVRPQEPLGAAADGRCPPAAPPPGRPPPPPPPAAAAAPKMAGAALCTAGGKAAALALAQCRQNRLA